MTALNVVQRRDRVFIMTDGAVYDSEGVLKNIVRKCANVPGRDMVVATSGSVKLQHDMLLLIAHEVHDIDDLIGVGPAFFERYLEEHLPQLCRVGCPDAMFVVAGWSNKFGAPVHVFYRDYKDERGFYVAPKSVWMPRTVGIPKVDPSTFDPRTDGVAMMERQRRDLAPEGYLVGGHVQLTELTRSGIKHEIIHRWPEDRVGEKIDPFNSGGVVVPMPQLSRQQRRQRERRALGSVA